MPDREKTEPTDSSPQQPAAEGIRPAHHTADGHFRNPHLAGWRTNLTNFLSARFNRESPWANHALQLDQIPRCEAQLSDIYNPGEAPQITWIGHSTFLIQYAGINLLTDPVFSDRVSPFRFTGPKRLTPLPITLKALPRIDLLVISHNHYDHLDRDTVRHFGNNTRYLVPLGLKSWLRRQGIDSARIDELDWWDSCRIGQVAATATPAQHWSGRGLNDRFRTLWASFHLDIQGFRVWFAGDTGYNQYQFREIGERLGGMDLALIPIGAYAPRWFMQPQHIDPAEAVKIHREIGAKFSIGMHWATFQLSAEALDDPRQKLALALSQAQAQTETQAGATVAPFVTLSIGETRQLKISG